jgi:hypothetical protein
MGRLTSLEYLFIDDNDLSGQLPESLGALVQLTNLCARGDDVRRVRNV